jgi:translation initiation factor IF-3
MIKEVRIRPIADEAECRHKLDNIIRFLEDSHQVNLTVMFRGREKAHPETGMTILSRFVKDLEDYASAEWPPVMDGFTMPLLFSPKHS